MDVASADSIRIRLLNEFQCPLYLHQFTLIRGNSKVSVQGFVALGSHFATLCQELVFYGAIFFSISILKKKKKIL